HRAENALADLRGELTAARADADAQRVRADAAEAKAAESARSVAAVDAKTAAPAVAPVVVDPTAAALAAGKANAEMQFLTDPALQQLSNEQFKSSLALRYGPLYAALGLDAATRTEFERILAARYDAEMMLGRDRILNNVSRDDPAFQARRAQTLGPIDAELSQLLGAGGMQQYQAFEQTAKVRGLVDALAGSVYYTAT